MMAYVLGQLVLASAFMTAVYLLVPRLAVGGVLFGVTVAEDFAASEAGRAIAARFRGQVVVAGVLGLLGITAGLALDSVPAGGLSVFVQVALCTAAWLAARARTRPHAVAPTTVRRAALAPETAAPLSPLLDLVPFALLAVTAVFVALSRDRIPARFPVHWGMEGPDRFADRSPASVFAPLLTGAVMCLGTLALRAVILGLSPLRPGDARTAAARRLLRTSLTGASLLLALTFSGVALAPMAGDPWPVFVLSGVGVVVLLGVIASSAVRLAALPREGRGDGTPDARWKLGLFYVNPDDPALFVPKRAGIGYTINLGRPGGILALLLVLVIPLAVAIFSALAVR